MFKMSDIKSLSKNQGYFFFSQLDLLGSLLCKHFNYIVPVTFVPQVAARMNSN